MSAPTGSRNSLVRAIAPILRDCVITEVHLQTNHLGWHTDDFLVVADTARLSDAGSPDK